MIGFGGIWRPLFGGLFRRWAKLGENLGWEANVEEEENCASPNNLNWWDLSPV
jgi:hypothetical protein